MRSWGRGARRSGGAPADFCAALSSWADSLDSDLAAVAAETEALQPGRPAGERQWPRREKLAAHPPRRQLS